MAFSEEQKNLKGNKVGNNILFAHGWRHLGKAKGKNEGTKE